MDLDAIGGPKYYNQYPAGWGQASNTPFRRYKNTVHNGGTRSPLIMAGSHYSPPRIHRPHDLLRHRHRTDDPGPGRYPCPPCRSGCAAAAASGALSAAHLRSAARLGPRGPQYFEVAGHRAIASGDWKPSPSILRAARSKKIGGTVRPRRRSGGAAVLSLSHPERLVALISQPWAEAQPTTCCRSAAEARRGCRASTSPGGDGPRPGMTPFLRPLLQRSHDFSVTIETKPIRPTDPAPDGDGHDFVGVSTPARRPPPLRDHALGGTSLALEPGAHLGADWVRQRRT